jgi:hypothetical protein
MLLSFETGSASDDHPQVTTVICSRGEPAKANAHLQRFLDTLSTGCAQHCQQRPLVQSGRLQERYVRQMW